MYIGMWMDSYATKKDIHIHICIYKYTHTHTTYITSIYMHVYRHVEGLVCH